MNATVAVEKAALRADLRNRRKRFVASLRDRHAIEARIAEAALRMLDGAACVAAYLAHGGEVDALPLMQALAARGTMVALPFADERDAPPEFRRWSPGDPLTVGPFGVRQPAAFAPMAEPDAIVVPLLGFDRSGVRLGQGAGWYDRAFALWPDTRRIGLAWSVQEERLLPREPWDVPLHHVVTEKGPR